MRIAWKVASFAGLVLTAVLLAAMFGAAHDQISYTIAPEYFTRFKFDQFGWAGVRAVPPRVGAAIVGVLATWWVGLYAGVLLAGAGFLHREPRAMVSATFRAYGVLGLAAIMTGLVALVVAWIGFGSNESAAFIDWWRPEGLTSPRRFFAVGWMHNGSYFGGAIGLLLGLGSQVRAARRPRRATVANAPAPIT